MESKDWIKNVKRIVIKVGTSTVTHETGQLNLKQMESLVVQIADLQNQGYEVLLVSSGAVGAGAGRLQIKGRPRTLPQKQASAAVGQGILIHMYQKFFSEFGKTIGQVLLTKDDFSDRRRFIHARSTLFEMLRNGIVPVINENDAVVVDEIRVGDNDTLSALVASLVEADLLVLLSDVDGLYTDNPQKNAQAKKISVVYALDDTIRNMSKGPGSHLGTGGMSTKMDAAEIATSAGLHMVIASGAQKGILNKIMDGENCGTLFWGQDSKLSSRRHWISFGSRIEGRIFVDAGAYEALKKRKSLLPAGICAVEGTFQKGMAVEVILAEGQSVAIGIVNYNAEEVKKLMGANTEEIEKRIGHNDYDEIIHADNLIVRR